MLKTTDMIETIKDIIYGPVKETDNTRGRRVYPTADIFDEYVSAAKRLLGRTQFGWGAIRKISDFDGKDNYRARQLKFNTAQYLAEVNRINRKYLLGENINPDFVSKEAKEILERAEMLETIKNKQAS